MPYTSGQVKQFPETEASIAASADEAGVGYIKSSQSTGCGHNDSMNRMPDPNKEWTNEESGEGKG